jgi:hypothetical protein
VMESEKSEALGVSGESDSDPSGETPEDRKARLRTLNPWGKKGKPKLENPDGLDDAGRFRLVWEQDRSKDQNDAQRRLRLILDGDPMGYFKLLHSLESKQKGMTDPSVLPPDETEERILKLIEELLEAAKRGAKL